MMKNWTIEKLDNIYMYIHSHLNSVIVHVYIHIKNSKNQILLVLDWGNIYSLSSIMVN